MLKSFKTLLDKSLLQILGSQCKDIDNNDPAGFKVPGFTDTHVGDTHDDVLFDIVSGV